MAVVSGVDFSNRVHRDGRPLTLTIRSRFTLSAQLSRRSKILAAAGTLLGEK